MEGVELGSQGIFLSREDQNPSKVHVKWLTVANRKRTIKEERRRVYKANRIPRWWSQTLPRRTKNDHKSLEHHHPPFT